MADLKFKPVTHDHNVFIEKAKKREGFKKGRIQVRSATASGGLV